MAGDGNSDFEPEESSKETSEMEDDNEDKHLQDASSDQRLLQSRQRGRSRIKLKGMNGYHSIQKLHIGRQICLTLILVKYTAMLTSWTGFPTTKVQPALSLSYLPFLLFGK